LTTYYYLNNPGKSWSFQKDTTLPDYC